MDSSITAIVRLLDKNNYYSIFKYRSTIRCNIIIIVSKLLVPVKVKIQYLITYHTLCSQWQKHCCWISAHNVQCNARIIYTNSYNNLIWITIIATAVWCILLISVFNGSMVFFFFITNNECRMFETLMHVGHVVSLLIFSKIKTFKVALRRIESRIISILSINM